MPIFTRLKTVKAVNVAPVICNCRLPYPRGRRWKERRVGSWTQGVGVGVVKRLGEGRVRKFRINKFAHWSL